MREEFLNIGEIPAVLYGGGGGLSLPHGYPQGQTLEVYQGAVPERKFSAADENLYRLDSADYPA